MENDCIRYDDRLSEAGTGEPMYKRSTHPLHRFPGMSGSVVCRDLLNRAIKTIGRLDIMGCLWYH